MYRFVKWGLDAPVDFCLYGNGHAGSHVHIIIGLVGDAFYRAFVPNGHRAMLSDDRDPLFLLINRKIPEKKLRRVMMLARFVGRHFRLSFRDGNWPVNRAFHVASMSRGENREF